MDWKLLLIIVCTTVALLASSLAVIFARMLAEQWKSGNVTVPMTGEALQLNDTTAPADSDSEAVTLPRIFFSTSNNGIWMFTPDTFTVKQYIEYYAYVAGLAFDPVHARIYFASQGTIYRENRKGTESVIISVYQTPRREWISGLAFDYIGMNLYAVRSGRAVLVCKAKSYGSLKCVTVAEPITRNLVGIAVNPNEGTMYWTGYYPGGIMKADLDGSNKVEVVSELNQPAGIAIDFNSSRIFWVDAGANKVQCSNLQGTNVQTVVQLPNRTAPWAIAVDSNMIYWGNYWAQTVQNRGKFGGNATVLYAGTEAILHLASATDIASLPRTRRNHCERIMCAGVCVLTPSSYRCVP